MDDNGAPDRGFAAVAETGGRGSAVHEPRAAALLERTFDECYGCGVRGHRYPQAMAAARGHH